MIELKDIPAVSIDPSKIVIRESCERARKDLGDIDELAISIIEKGQIQPILITREHELIAGERRLRACQSVPIPVLAIYKDQVDDMTMKEIELEENIQRKDMTWQEKLKLTREITILKQEKYGKKKAGKNQEGWSLTDTAELMGKSPSGVAGDMQLAEALEKIPGLKKAKTADDAKKLMRKMEEELLVAELLKREEDKPSAYNFAKYHYAIGDAFEELKKVKNSFCDFADVDTPYGINLTDMKKSQTDTKELKKIGTYQEWDKESFIATSRVVAEHMFRILKNNSFCTWWFGYEHYATLRVMLEDVGFKLDPVPALWFAGTKAAQCNQPQIMFAKSYDTFFLCRKGNPVLAKPGRINVFEEPKVDADKKIHPTEKPLELYYKILETIVLPGSNCIVPFLGSGNALRALYMNKSKGFGYDLDENIRNRFLLRVNEDIERCCYGIGGAK